MTTSILNPKSIGIYKCPEGEKFKSSYMEYMKNINETPLAEKTCDIINKSLTNGIITQRFINIISLHAVSEYNDMICENSSKTYCSIALVSSRKNADTITKTLLSICEDIKI